LSKSEHKISALGSKLGNLKKKSSRNVEIQDEPPPQPISYR